MKEDSRPPSSHPMLPHLRRTNASRTTKLSQRVSKAAAIRSTNTRRFAPRCFQRHERSFLLNSNQVIERDDFRSGRPYRACLKAAQLVPLVLIIGTALHRYSAPFQIAS